MKIFFVKKKRGTPYRMKFAHEYNFIEKCEKRLPVSNRRTAKKADIFFVGFDEKKSNLLNMNKGASSLGTQSTPVLRPH